MDAVENGEDLAWLCPQCRKREENLREHFSAEGTTPTVSPLPVLSSSIPGTPGNLQDFTDIRVSVTSMCKSSQSWTHSQKQKENKANGFTTASLHGSFSSSAAAHDHLQMSYEAGILLVPAEL